VVLAHIPEQPGRLYVGRRNGIHAGRRRDCRCGRLAGWTLHPGRLEDSSQPDHQPGPALGSEYASRLQGGRGAAWIPGTQTVAGFANSAPGQQSTMYPNAPAGLNFPGDPGVPNTLMNSDYNYWEPRIGVAYQPKFLPHTVIHAGFGMFTGPLQYSEYNHAADVAPFSPTFNYSGWCWPCSADTALAGDIIPFDHPWSATPFVTSPFPGTFPWASLAYKPAKSVAIPAGQQVGQVFARNFKLPTTYAWNVSVEQQLTPTTALRLAYVGNETEHLSVLIDMNPEWATKIPVNPNIGDIYDDQSWATASYNSLQFSLDQHVWHGLQVQSNFTWAHSIDVASSSNVSFGNPALGNPISAKWNRGNSNAGYAVELDQQLYLPCPLVQGKGQADGRDGRRLAVERHHHRAERQPVLDWPVEHGPRSRHVE
jgi:hypothetical protein